jgi:hypothetical protein
MHSRDYGRAIPHYGPDLAALFVTYWLEKMLALYRRWIRLGLARHVMKNSRSQFCLYIITAILLAGCSSLAPTHNTAPVKAHEPIASAPAPTPQPAPARPKRTAAKETHETREPERVAVIDPKSLIGLQPAAVEKLLGAPSAVVKSDPSLVWTYSGQGCSLQIVFYPDLKTESYHALKYTSTAGAEADNACVRNILTVKSNGPS